MRRTINRRQVIASLGAGVAGPAFAQLGGAAPVKLVIPYAAGGAADVLTRLLADSISTALQRPVVFEYKPGANGIIACEYVLASPADGSTFLVGSLDSMGLNPFLYRALKFKTTDFVPIAQTSLIPLALIGRKNLGVSGAGDLIVTARQKQMTYSTWGNGSMGHVGMELLRQKANIPSFVHVPYKGAAPAVQAVLAGEVDLMLAPFSLVNAHRSSTTVLGVASAKRFEGAPDIPTTAETGFELITDTWNGIFAPPRVPAKQADAMAGAVATALRNPEVARKLVAAGAAVPAVRSRQDFGELLNTEIRKWGPIIQTAAIQLD